MLGKSVKHLFNFWNQVLILHNTIQFDKFFSIFRACSDPYVTTSTSYWGIRFSPIVAILELGRTLGTEQKVFCSSPSLLGDERKVFRSVPRVLPSLRSTSTRGLAELSLLSINKKNWMKFWNTSASGGVWSGDLWFMRPRRYHCAILTCLKIYV